MSLHAHQLPGTFLPQKSFFKYAALNSLRDFRADHILKIHPETVQENLLMRLDVRGIS
jgi:hypothetical protein